MKLLTVAPVPLPAHLDRQGPAIAEVDCKARTLPWEGAQVFPLPEGEQDA